MIALLALFVTATVDTNVWVIVLCAVLAGRLLLLSRDSRGDGIHVTGSQELAPWAFSFLGHE